MWGEEFIVINTSDKKKDDFTVFADNMLFEGNILKHGSIPFTFEIMGYFPNCRPLKRVYIGEESFHGMAKNFFLQELESEKEYEQNIRSMCIRCLRPGPYIIPAAPNCFAE